MSSVRRINPFWGRYSMLNHSLLSLLDRREKEKWALRYRKLRSDDLTPACDEALVSPRVYWTQWFLLTLITHTHWSCQSMLLWMGSVQYCHRWQLVKVRHDTLLLQARPSNYMYKVFGSQAWDFGVELECAWKVQPLTKRQLVQSMDRQQSTHIYNEEAQIRCLRAVLDRQACSIHLQSEAHCMGQEHSGWHSQPVLCVMTIYLPSLMADDQHCFLFV